MGTELQLVIPGAPVVLITGGPRGIGRATAQACVDAGARVVIADIDEAAANATADELSAGVVATAKTRRRRQGRVASLFLVRSSSGRRAGIRGRRSPLPNRPRKARHRNGDAMIAPIAATPIIAFRRRALVRLRSPAGASLVTISIVSSATPAVQRSRQRPRRRVGS
jgi:NAD(P)-dependent dehydrogenase (short-subunit alcohol dehydrogenase family)